MKATMQASRNATKQASSKVTMEVGRLHNAGKVRNKENKAVHVKTD